METSSGDLKTSAQLKKETQLSVICVVGYMSRVTRTIISNPADNMITAINNRKGVSHIQVRYHPGIVSSRGVLIDL